MTSLYCSRGSKTGNPVITLPSQTDYPSDPIGVTCPWDDMPCLHQQDHTVDNDNDADGNDHKTMMIMVMMVVVMVMMMMIMIMTTMKMTVMMVMVMVVMMMIRMVTLMIVVVMIMIHNLSENAIQVIVPQAHQFSFQPAHRLFKTIYHNVKTFRLPSTVCIGFCVTRKETLCTWNHNIT